MGLPQIYTPPSFGLAQDQYAFDLWCRQGSNNDPAYKHLMNAFRVAIRNELTEQHWAELKKEISVQQSKKRA